MFESKAGIIFIAGIGFFALAFVSNALVPVLMYKDLPEKTAEQMVNEKVLYQFNELSRRYAESFAKHIGEPNAENCAATLRLGRQIYIGEGCWHCHSQFVRPVSNESRRFGAVSETWEYQNELQRPVMFGTRRVGPDLSREGGRRSSDWHAVHFFRPKMVSADSPMPEYSWFFDGTPDKPNKRGLAIITYMQWLGSWHDTYPYYEELDELKMEETY
jgi:hypothetical protein